MSKRTSNGADDVIIFRRFRRDRAGRVLDAWKYGLRAWPIRIRRRRLKV